LATLHHSPRSNLSRHANEAQTSEPLRAQRDQNDYDEVHPWLGFEQRDAGPDSAAVAAFLADLAASRGVVCQIAANNLGNNWHQSNGEYRTGTVQGEGVQEAARGVVGHRVTDPRALARLSDALRDQSACVRRAASHLLGQSRTAEAQRLLRAGLRAHEAPVREAAALGLACADGPASLAELSQALHDKEPSVVRMVAYALGQIEDARAVKPLGQLLRATDPETRATAAEALGDIEDIRTVDHLTPLVRDPDVRVRVATVEALGNIEDHRSTGALTDALHDRDVTVRRSRCPGG
jgi:HEAT repeat protein